MSEGTQNNSDEQPVIGEPASQPHQAVVVGEPPEDDAPVLGEPALANGLQDQQLIRAPSSEETSANGVQSSPHVPVHAEELVTVEPRSDVSAPSSAAPVEETPNLQHASSADDCIGEADTHQQEAAAAESFNPSDSHVGEVTSASNETIGGSTDAATTSIHCPVCSTEEQPAVDIPEVVEVTHIVPPEASLPPSEVPTENSFGALSEDLATSPQEILDRDAHATDGAPSSNPEVSLKGLDDQEEEATLSSAAQEEDSMENPTSMQTDPDDGPLGDSKADDESAVQAAEAKQVGQGGAAAQESEAKEANLEEKETGSSVVEHPLTPELDEASKTGAPLQGNDTREYISGESETISREGGHVLSKEASQSKALESSSPEKVILNEGCNVPIAADTMFAEPPPMDHGTRNIAAEECSVNQPLKSEASFTATANGNNSHQHGEDGEVEREQDLPKDDAEASEEVEKPSPRSKLPLIFTGLAIAAVGVAVASISRPH